MKSLSNHCKYFRHLQLACSFYSAHEIRWCVSLQSNLFCEVVHIVTLGFFVPEADWLEFSIEVFWSQHGSFTADKILPLRTIRLQGLNPVVLCFFLCLKAIFVAVTKKLEKLYLQSLIQETF